MSRVKGGYVTRRRRKRTIKLARAISEPSKVSHSKPGCDEVTDLCVSR